MNKVGIMYKAWNFSKNGLPDMKDHYGMDHIHLWIMCGLFNDVVNSSDNVWSDDRKINEE
jgi:hypothetical protein